jgi:hypothetical protein
VAEDIAFTHRFVAGPDTAKQIAWVGVGCALRRKTVWTVPLLSVIPMSLMINAALDSTYSLMTRLFWTPLATLPFALVATLLSALLVAMTTYRTTRQSAELRAFDGAVLETGFGVHEWVSRTPRSSTRSRYSTVRSLDVRGDFVLIRKDGLPPLAVWPKQNFPDAAIARMRDYNP